MDLNIVKIENVEVRKLYMGELYAAFGSLEWYMEYGSHDTEDPS